MYSHTRICWVALPTSLKQSSLILAPVQGGAGDLQGLRAAALAPAAAPRRAPYAICISTHSAPHGLPPPHDLQHLQRASPEDIELGKPLARQVRQPGAACTACGSAGSAACAGWPAGCATSLACRKHTRQGVQFSASQPTAHTWGCLPPAALWRPQPHTSTSPSSPPTPYPPISLPWIRLGATKALRLVVRQEQLNLVPLGLASP